MPDIADKTIDISTLKNGEANHSLIHKNWNNRILPKDFLDWRKQESDVLVSLSNTENIIDFCCGDATILDRIYPHVNSYIGIDYDRKSISAAHKHYGHLKNVNFSRPVDYSEFISHDLDKYKSRNEKYFAISIGNAIGPLSPPTNSHIIRMACTADKFFLSTLKKGNIDLRIKYYEAIGDTYHVDYEQEIIYSDTWGSSHSFSNEDFDRFTESLKVFGFRVKAVYDFGRLAHAIYFLR